MLIKKRIINQQTSKKVYDSNNQKEQAISTSTGNMFEIKKMECLFATKVDL